MQVSGAAATALRSLTSAQKQFIQSLPKAELHAHLNGSIPISLLQDLAAERLKNPDQLQSGSVPATIVQAGLDTLAAGPALDEIDDFFHLFPAIYALTSTPDALRRATLAVLSAFLDGDDDTPAQAAYLELRTTPRATSAMTRAVYITTVLDALELYPSSQAALIVSLDRRMSVDDLNECADLACSLRKEGRRVVGLDLCGDPMAGNMELLAPVIAKAKAAGLGITMHIAETAANPNSETLQLLSYGPSRLGHATFLDADAIALVLKEKMCIEICLSSNLLCKTVPSLEAHHISQYLYCGHPVAICTDDVLPFRTSLVAEYALLLAEKPYGLGLSEAQVRRIAEMSMEQRFR